MQFSNIPGKIVLPWGANAASGYINTVPVQSQIGVSGKTGYASYNDGFVPANATPIAAGGVPPRIKDENGVLFDVTGAARWFWAGGPIFYDSVFSSAVGGYPNGAIVQSSSIPAYSWLNTVDSNTTNPDSGGTGWVSAEPGRLLNIQTFSTPGNSYTYHPTAGTNSIIVIVVGGGGAGGNAAATGSGQVSAGPGGGAGGFAMKRITSNFNPVVVQVGYGGAIPANPAGTPGNCTTSSFGNVSGTGGAGGGICAATTTPTSGAFPNGITNGGGGINGDINGQGGIGTYAFLYATPTSGPGGASYFGAGANYVTAFSGQVNGTNAITPGSGGGGGAAAPGTIGAVGGAGAPGIVIVYEYS